MARPRMRVCGFDNQVLLPYGAVLKYPTLELKREDERFLWRLRGQGRAAARELARAHILLASAKGVSVAEMQRVLGVSRMLIWRTQAAYRERGLEYALYDAPRSGQPRKYQARHQAEVIALARSKPPAGTSRWTVQGLTQAARRRPALRTINRESVRQILKAASVSLAGG